MAPPHLTVAHRHVQHVLLNPAIPHGIGSKRMQQNLDSSNTRQSHGTGIRYLCLIAVEEVPDDKETLFVADATN